MHATTRRRLLLLSIVLCAVSATVAGAAVKPAWQVIPVGVDQRGTVFAAGRAWFYSGLDSGNFRAKSARVANGRLSGWTTATLNGSAAWRLAGQKGQELIFSSLRSQDLEAVKLLPNGSFGARTEFVSGAPPPAYSSGAKVIQLPDRVIQFVDACDYVKPPEKPCRDLEGRIGACCDVNGDAVSYASFVPRGALEPPRFGLDRRGRLWLAWRGPRDEHPVEIVQLDPKTLEPRGKPTAMPGTFSYVRTVELVCSDVCRFVGQAYRPGRRNPNPNATWAPGERSLTPIKLPGSSGTVFAARAGPGGLELAVNYSVVTPKRTVRMAGTARADPRGRNARLISSVEVPEVLGSFAQGQHLTIEPRNGAFGPTGYVTTAVWEGRGRQIVRSTVLPLR
jgi:hypothetical protein